MILKYRGECGTLLNIMWQPGWAGNLGERGTSVCMTGSLHYSAATVTTSLLGHTPGLNKKLKKRIWNKCMEKLVCMCRYDDVSLGTRVSVLMVLTNN